MLSACRCELHELTSEYYPDEDTSDWEKGDMQSWLAENEVRNKGHTVGVNPVEVT
jgi:hypothetical protein